MLKIQRLTANFPSKPQYFVFGEFQKLFFKAIFLVLLKPQYVVAFRSFDFWKFI